MSALREPTASSGEGHLGKGYGLVRSRPERVYELMWTSQAKHSIRVMACVLGISTGSPPSGGVAALAGGHRRSPGRSRL